MLCKQKKTLGINKFLIVHPHAGFVSKLLNFMIVISNGLKFWLSGIPLHKQLHEDKTWSNCRGKMQLQVFWVISDRASHCTSIRWWLSGQEKCFHFKAYFVTAQTQVVFEVLNYPLCNLKKYWLTLTWFINIQHHSADNYSGSKLPVTRKVK